MSQINHREVYRQQRVAGQIVDNTVNRHQQAAAHPAPVQPKRRTATDGDKSTTLAERLGIKLPKEPEVVEKPIPVPITRTPRVVATPVKPPETVDEQLPPISTPTFDIDEPNDQIQEEQEEPLI